LKVTNNQAEALETNITLAEFGTAMSQINLDGVPEHRKSDAIRDHLAKVMAEALRDKEKAQELHISRILKGAL